MTLEVGDKVRILNGGHFLDHMIGRVGIIKYIWPEGMNLPYHVECPTQWGNFAENELEPIGEQVGRA